MTLTTGAALAMSQAGIEGALTRIGAAAAPLWAVLSTETSGCGFQPDGKPKILFERHIFHRLTGGRFDAQDPDVSAPTAGGYGPGGDHQYGRLRAAMLLDEAAALQSASWGLGQIMGENHASAGFPDVHAMVAGYCSGEDTQLESMVTFIAARGMAVPLAGKHWTQFARLYNGPDYAKNDYDGKLKHFCGIYEAQGAPDVMLRAAQMYLTFLGYTVGGIDGIQGSVTTAAIQQFLVETKSQAEPEVTAALLASLQARVAERNPPVAL